MSARLGASGTRIVNGSGNTVVLHSVNVDGNEYSKNDNSGQPYLSADDITRMKSHGGNCLECCGLYVKRMQPSRGVIDSTYLAMLDRLVNLCETSQMYMIFSFDDMSYTSWSSTMPDWMLDGHGYGTAPYSEATVNQAVLDFWDTAVTKQNDNRQSYTDMWVFLADRYKDKQYVMFDFANEPFSHCPITSSTQSQHMGVSYAAIIEGMIDAVRSVSTNLIFVDKPYVWFNPVASPWLNDIQPINRSNIVWEDHLYIAWSPVTTMSAWKTGIDTMVAKYTAAFGKPFYLGEYAPYPDGPYPANISEWNPTWAEMAAYLETKNLAGYAWHTWAILYGEVYTRDNPARTFKTEAESETFLNIVYPASSLKRYVFSQWENGDVNNPRIISV